MLHSLRTSRSRVLLEKLIVAHLAVQFLTLYDTRMFITVFTTAHIRILF